MVVSSGSLSRLWSCRCKITPLNSTISVMSEKKKKFVPFKDVVTSRRPVILKSDRETPKEPEKEKIRLEKLVEKEKQPTILLKPREPSTPKEETRPQSPKPQQSNDSESNVIPSKIAQNEHKEKRFIEQKQCVPIPPMGECVKLLDDKLEFNPAAAEFLHDANSNYLVVGILGAQGVGKSTILNLLAHDKPLEELCSRITSSHELVSSPSYDDEAASINDQLEGLHFVDTAETGRAQEAMEQYFKFKMQDIEQIERAQHCTKGIDMFVTSDRVVLLDSQALFSPSALEEGSATGATPVTVRGSTVATVDCLQVASYLMAVCHVLILVQDWCTDYNLLRFIQTAEMLKPCLSASSAGAAAAAAGGTVGEAEAGGGGCGGGDLLPHLLLLQNRCQLEDFQPANVRVMQDLYRKVFESSKLQLNSGMYLYSDYNKNGLNIDAVGKGMNLDTCGAPINLFLLPEIYDDYGIDMFVTSDRVVLLDSQALFSPSALEEENGEIYRGHPPFEELAFRLRWMVYGAHRHQLTNVANLSEKGWFHYCNKAWETIRKSTFFMEYGRLLP